jgi:hypothetical protein
MGALAEVGAERSQTLLPPYVPLRKEAELSAENADNAEPTPGHDDFRRSAVVSAAESRPVTYWINRAN